MTGPEARPHLFAATVGGLGLTGVIAWVELQLHAVASSDFEVQTLRLGDLDAFFRVAGESHAWPYTVAWVDCLASGRKLGRGLFSRGRHAADGALVPHGAAARLKVPRDAPPALLGPATVRLFNAAYSRQPATGETRRVPYGKFLYPLDGITDWNRLYGGRGFYQHQSVVPTAAAPRALQALLELTSSEGQGSFLVVLKLFGPRPSPGILSFPREGATFALDLPNRGPDHAAPARPHGRGRARGGRAALSRQGRHNVGGAVPRPASRAGARSNPTAIPASRRTSGDA